jgi:sortase A
MKIRVLAWIERGLFAAGAGLAVWCAIVVLQAEYYKRLPVPSPTAGSVATLPGETPHANLPSVRRPTVKAGDWVARLEAPTVALSATVLEGSDDGTLMRGAGHIEDTALPGDLGNIAIAGHRDTIFRPVRKLRIGDPLVLTTATRVFRYRISKTAMVNPEDVYVLDPTDHPTMTLVTCYPFEFIGHAPQRYIVSADLLTEAER